MATPRFETIADDFALLDDWEDRYRYVIELGKAMPPLEAELRTPSSKVDGCASQVWLVGQSAGAGARFDFRGDSDAMIVRGLIAVLHDLFAGLDAKEVLRVDVPAEFARLGLDAHLSAQRSNGVRAMVGRLRNMAEAMLHDA